MNNRTKLTTSLLLLAISLAWLGIVEAKGPRVKVEQAIPGEAEQGRQNLPVKIKGQNFQAGDGVLFLVTDTSDDSQVDVLSVVFDEATGDLDAVINVSETATVSDYDIEVTRSGGRGGKGTGLFKVKQPGGGGGSSHLGDDYTATEGVTFINPSDVSGFDYHIIGSQSHDEIYAGSGADLIEGGEGSDHISARGGDDEIHAGSGGGGIITAGDGDDVIYGGINADTIYGDDGEDIIFGDADNDVLHGGLGTDWLEGGDGHDRLLVSLGSFDAASGQYEVDHYDGNLGDDGLDFGYWTHEPVESVFVDMALNSYEATVRDPSGTLVTVSGDFSGIEFIFGSPGDDILLGDESDNKLSGGDGYNVINGYGGNDSLSSGFGTGVVYGGSGNDWIQTWTGNDILFGEAGDDVLIAFRGDDELHGGEGCDSYIFQSDSGTDIIMDFDYPYDEPACDRIYLSYSSYRHVSMRNVNFNEVGDDLIIEIVLKRPDTGGTIILKDAVLNGVTVDESNLILANPPDRDCSRYWCSDAE